MMNNLDLVPLDAYTEAIVPQAKPLHTSALRAKLLWIWYDYFSCPQLEPALSQGSSFGRNSRKSSNLQQGLPNLYCSRSLGCLEWGPFQGDHRQDCLLIVSLWKVNTVAACYKLLTASPPTWPSAPSSSLSARLSKHKTGPS